MPPKTSGAVESVIYLFIIPQGTRSIRMSVYFIVLVTTYGSIIGRYLPLSYLV